MTLYNLVFTYLIGEHHLQNIGLQIVIFSIEANVVKNLFGLKL